MSNRLHVSIITDGQSPQNTEIWHKEEKLPGVQSVKTVRDGRLVEITLLAELDNIRGAAHPFEMAIHRAGREEAPDTSWVETKEIKDVDK